MNQKEWRLLLAIIFSTTFMIIEVLGGFWAGSLAVLSDAAHLLTDIFGFSLALAAAVYSNRAATKDFTFGLGRAEVLGALGSILTLWVMTGWLLYEATSRTIDWVKGEADPVDGKIMFIVACLGVGVNIALATIFSTEHGGAFHAHDHSHGHGHGDEHDHSHSHGHNHKDHNNKQAIEMNTIISKDRGHNHSHNHSDGAHDHHEHSHNSRCSHSHEGVSYQALKTVEEPSSLKPTMQKPVPVESHDHSHSHSHSSSCNHNHDHDHSKESHSTQEGHDRSSSVTQTIDDADSVSILITESTPSVSYQKYTSYGSVSIQEGIDDKEHGHDHPHDFSRGLMAEEVCTTEKDVNIEAAYLHVITDLIQSVGVALAGLVIWFFPTLQIFDPICTFIFSGLVMYSTLSLFKRVMSILFEGTPPNFPWEALWDELERIEGVVGVHDLHVWNVTTSSIAMTCHIQATSPQNVLVKALNVAKSYDIHHSTIQVQQASNDSTENPCHSHWCASADTKFKCFRK